MKMKLAKIAVLVIVILSSNILFQSIVVQGGDLYTQGFGAGFKAGVKAGWSG
jgi:hypothetical protein